MFTKRRRGRRRKIKLLPIPSTGITYGSPRNRIVSFFRHACFKKAIAVDEILRILISRPSVSPVATC